MIRLFHAYPDLLNICGGDADLLFLAARLRAAGEEVVITPFTREETPAFPEGSLVYFGAATENKMLAAAKALSRLKPSLERFWKNGGHIVCVGASVALPLEKIVSLSGESVSGLSLVAGEARVTDKRVYTEVAGSCEWASQPVIGAYNSSLKIETPAPAFLSLTADSAGKLDGREGYLVGPLAATELATPFLRNPALADGLLASLLGKPLSETNESWYRQAVAGYEAAKPLFSR